MPPISDPTTLAKKVVEAITNEPCYLFAGAGTAARAGLVTWFSYVEYLAVVAEKYEPLVAQLMRKYLESKLLLEAAHLYKTCPKIPRGELYCKAAEPFVESKYDPEKLHPLASLPFAAIITTNYDRSLHDAVSLSKKVGIQCVELNDPTIREALYWTKFFIARIHGRAEVPNTMVLDADDYLTIYANAEYQDFLHHVLTQKSCFFVGFSFLDPAIERILAYIAEKGVQPKKHYALVPPVEDGLVERLAKYNIEVVLYNPQNDHEILWKGIAQAETQLRSRKYKSSSPLPSGFDTAKRLLAVCYARAKMEGTDVTALRLIVVQGILLSELGRGIHTFSSLSEALRQYFALSPDEAKLQVGAGIEALEQKGFCERKDNEIKLMREVSSQEGLSATATLVNGIIARLRVRERYEVPPTIRTAIANITDEVIVLRGFDLGADFSGADTSEELNPLPTINAAIDRYLKEYWQDRKRYIAEAFVDLLRHPDRTEEAVLAELGRISFGIEVVLQAGRSTMYSLSLPEVIYLDASVVLPAIVSGHPYQAAYMDAIRRLQEASRHAGRAAAVLIADVFLDEILNHRRKAMELVSERGLEDTDTLHRRVMYYGAERVNVFISGYSTWVKSSRGEPSFEAFLASEAPYSTKEQLKIFLQQRGMSVINSQPKSQADVKLQHQAIEEVMRAYELHEAGLEQWQKKALILKNGERVEKCQAASATTACPTSGTNGKLYWKGTGSDPLAESDLAGNPTEEYIFFNGTRIARRDVSSTGATIAMHYYFSDHLGTHAVVENATGTQCEQDIDYYPYGGQQNDYCTTPVVQVYKFNGKERDGESGLDNFGARYNTSNLGRWMTPDWAAKPTTVPYANFGNPQSLNLYGYVENNPTTVGDPDGHYECNGNECKQVKKALKDINKAASSKKLTADQRAALKGVVAFYGKAGTNNGVTVNTGNAAAGAMGGTHTDGDGKTTISLNLSKWSSKNANLNGGSAKVEKAGTVAHEGEHGVQQKAAGMPGNAGQEFQGEQQAYTVQSYVNEGLNTTSAYGTWTPGGGFNQQQIDAYATRSTDLWCGCDWAPPAPAVPGGPPQ